MKSANQRYKYSDSELSFKEWIDNENKSFFSKDQFVNADGGKNDKVLKSIKTNNIIGLISVGLLAFGLWKISSQNNEML